MNNERRIRYIYDNVNELLVKERIEVLQMLLYSDIDGDKITEKGSGTQIKFSDIKKPMIKKIYNFIFNKLENRKLTLN